VDIDSFSDAAPEVREDAVLDIAVETPAATEAPVAAEALLLLKPLQLLMSLCPFTPATKLPPSSLRSSNSLFRGEDLVQSPPLLEVREVVLKGQAPSPSLAAFNKSFSTSHRGELLSVGFKATSTGSKTSKILTL
jgi:hypothetical protein